MVFPDVIQRGITLLYSAVMHAQYVAGANIGSLQRRRVHTKGIGQLRHGVIPTACTGRCIVKAGDNRIKEFIVHDAMMF